MTFEITEPAERDIRDILRETLKTFGTTQLEIYRRILIKGIELVADDPDRPGSHDRSDTAPGVRSLHLERAAGKRGAAAHCLYYTTGRTSDGSIGTIVLRVLHEHMDPRRRIVRSLNAFARGSKR